MCRVIFARLACSPNLQANGPELDGARNARCRFRLAINMLVDCGTIAKRIHNNRHHARALARHHVCLFKRCVFVRRLNCASHQRPSSSRYHHHYRVNMQSIYLSAAPHNNAIIPPPARTLCTQSNRDNGRYKCELLKRRLRRRRKHHKVTRSARFMGATSLRSAR